MPAPLRILYIDDYPLDRELVLDALEKEHDGFKVTLAGSRAEFETALTSGEFDLVLSDFNITGYEGLQVLEAAHAKDPALPVVIVTGTGSEEVAVEAVKRGAADYVIKTPKHIQRLPLTIHAALAKKQMESERRQAALALRESEERYRDIFDSVQEAILVASLDGHILTVNNQACEMYGYGREEFLTKTMADLMADGQSGLVQNGQTITGPAEFVERVHRRAGSESFPTEINARFQAINGQKVVLVVVRDITTRKRADQKIQRQIEYLTALRYIDQAIASSFDLRVSVNALLSRAINVLAVDAASILLITPGLKTLKYAGGTGFRTNLVKTANVEMGKSYAGKVALEQRVIELPNLNLEPENLFISGFLKDENFVSYYGAPLVIKGKVVGVLEVFGRSLVERDDDWLDFFITLAGQAAIAVDNARLFETLQISNTELFLAYEATIEGWSRALDLRDKETEGHTRRVTEMSLQLARLMGIAEDELVNIRRGALLHDMGKLGVPDHILLKAGPLTEDEWAIMRQHPVFAADMLTPIRYLKSAAIDIPYCHHEKWDGSGYPRGLSGEAIPLAARIFAVVDVFDALTSERPYRPAWSQAQALDHIRSLAGTHFDPAVVKVFLSLVEPT
jgi:PAS domain S-box-containing protein